MSRRTVTSPLLLILLLLVLIAVAVWIIRAYTQGLPPFESHAQVALSEEPDGLTSPPQSPRTEPPRDARDGSPDERSGAAEEEDTAGGDDEADDGWVDISEFNAAKEVSEERYIQISVRFVIAAIGFQNAGQGNEELAEYFPTLLAEEGVTLDAFEQATNEISSDPAQADRVANEIVRRVRLATGVKMDMDHLQMFKPAPNSD